MSLEKVSAKHSANKKKKIITIELKKEIMENQQGGVCVVDLNKPITPKNINDVHFLF